MNDEYNDTLFKTVPKHTIWKAIKDNWDWETFWTIVLIIIMILAIVGMVFGIKSCTDADEQKKKDYQKRYPSEIVKYYNIDTVYSTTKNVYVITDDSVNGIRKITIDKEKILFYVSPNKQYIKVYLKRMPGKKNGMFNGEKYEDLNKRYDWSVNEYGYNNYDVPKFLNIFDGENLWIKCVDLDSNECDDGQGAELGHYRMRYNATRIDLYTNKETIKNLTN